MRLKTFYLGLVAASLLIYGCGGGDAESEQYTVSGQLHAAGEPIAGVGLGFFEKESGFIGGADTDEAGTYSSELPAGEYIVTVALPLEEVQENAGSPPNEIEVEDERIPDSVQTKSTSPITIVVEGDMSDADLDLSIY